MYSPRRSYGSPPPELSNNPFIDHPSNALSRFPDIDGSDDPTVSTQFTSWMQRPSSLSSPSSSFSGAGGTPGQYGGYGQQQIQPQQTSWGGPGPGLPGGGYGQQQQGYTPGLPLQGQATGMPFQPSSGFGQQLASQVGASGYGGYPQQQQQQQQPQFQQQQYGGYAPPTSPQYGPGYQQGYVQPPSQQQITPQYAPEFDPLLSSGGQTGSGYGGGGGAGSGAGGGFRPLHPREYVQQHKAELETWDSYSWKQAQNSFDTLKEAWGTRKREIEARVRAMGGQGLFSGGAYGGYNPQAQEMQRLESLIKQAESNFDSVAASAFQFHEVYSGYRQSGDLASKRRVRESINAALNSLPDWPPQTW
ncbi:hypothetical protein OBBRIDRAFT_767641 [Obba rivulosa]|uniref:Uncharacterized protein n=1 Tax=Obba rivulosa TaxID=1052685 RepID=A0A8E2DTG6_9APHY|nr:hypothetical protein OBBRIDRAFT_767641 [Obba rivulosa]